MFVGPDDTASRIAIGLVFNGYDFTEWQIWKMSKQT